MGIWGIRFFSLLFCCVLLVSDRAGAETKNILLLNSFPRQLPWQQTIEKGFFPEFQKGLSRSEDNINLFIENLDVFRSDMPGDLYFEFIKSKYGNKKIHLIITNDFAALDFADSYLWAAFRNSEIFAFADIDHIKNLKHIESLGYFTSGKIRFSETLTLIEQLHPKTEKIVVVTGKSANSLRFKSAMEEDGDAFFASKAEFWVEISYKELIHRAKQLTGSSVLFYLPFMTDRLGKRYMPLKVLAELSRVSSVPIYSAWDTFMGEGIVGGKVLSAETAGQLMARHAHEIIRGKTAGQIRYSPEELHTYIFDQRQLDRFGIPASNLPEGSIVRYKHPSFWEKYKWYITAGLALCVVETFLIFFLVLNRKKRLRIEGKLRESHDLLEEKVAERTSELTRVNDDLRTSEEKFRSLSKAAFEGICITEDRRILEVNNNMQKMFGYSSEQFSGMDAIDLVAPDDRKNVKDKMAAGFGQTYEANALRKDRSVFPVEIHAKMFFYKGRKTRVTALSDITERRASEKERERLIDELQKVIDEIKTLKGIVPICSGCKKIRDDKGYWNQLESFIEKHSDASFSHGMCPECSDRFYGNEDWYIAMKKKKGTPGA